MKYLLQDLGEMVYLLVAEEMICDIHNKINNKLLNLAESFPINRSFDLY